MTQMTLHSFTISGNTSDAASMTHKRITRALAPLALGLAAGLFAAEAAPGQTIPSSYRHLENGQETGVFGGYIYLTRGSWDLGPKSALYMGGRYAIEVSGPLFAEGLLTYLPTTRDVVDPRRAQGDLAIGETDVHLLAASARLAFSLTGRRSWRRLAPHVFVGGGLAVDFAGTGELEEVLQPEDRFDFGTALTLSTGTGLRIFPSDRVAIRLDGSVLLWRLNTPTGFGEPEKGLEGVTEREWVRGLGVTLGVAIRF